MHKCTNAQMLKCSNAQLPNAKQMPKSPKCQHQPTPTPTPNPKTNLPVCPTGARLGLLALADNLRRHELLRDAAIGLLSRELKDGTQVSSLTTVVRRRKNSHAFLVVVVLNTVVHTLVRPDQPAKIPTLLQEFVRNIRAYHFGVLEGSKSWIWGVEIWESLGFGVGKESTEYSEYHPTKVQ